MTSPRRAAALVLGAVAIGAGLTALSNPSDAASVPAPVFGKLVTLIRVSGSVRATPPGRPTVRVTGTRQVPVGSVIDVSSGVVQLVIADVNHTTHSGQFSQGAFKVLQSATGDGSAELDVEGASCGKAVDASHTAPAMIAAHHPRPRHFLQVSAGGEFRIVAGNTSASASGQAVFSLVAACDGTHIEAQKGTVQAKGSTGPVTLKPKQSLVNYCYPPGAKATFCLLMISRPSSSVFSFGLLLEPGQESQWQLCYTPPGKAKSCHAGPLAPSANGTEAGVISCIVNDGPGTYPTRWFVAGRQKGITLSFKATQPRAPELGSDSCSAQVINLTP